ncbi:MAG: ABC transporter permease [Desulfobacterium sp.]|nr:ABC transporter permease [Desulfobacterium sp.]
MRGAAVIRESTYLVLVLLGVSWITFSMIYLAPGDPAELLLSSGLESADPARVMAVREELGLNRPLVVQYFAWLKRLASGDLGCSFRTGDPVAREILSRLPATLCLAGATFLFTVAGSLALGLLGALKQNRSADHVIGILGILSISVPDYWLGILLILLFSLKLGWLPVMGFDGTTSLILPVFTLGLSMAVVQGRVLRASLLEIMGQEYILFARSKGLSGRVIVLRHLLKNALVPVVVMWGTCLGSLLGGAVIIESVFAWPGIGKLAVDAVLGRDLPLLQGVVLVMGFSYVLCNRLADLACRCLDPRWGREGR